METIGIYNLLSAIILANNYEAFLHSTSQLAAWYRSLNER